MGSYDRDRILALAERLDLPASVYIRQETLRGRPWYVLIHSLHATYEDAQAEHGRLPEDLARLDTWIRRLPADAGLEPIPTGRAP
jgi:DamX protein